jgi:hypothetical protein
MKNDNAFDESGNYCPICNKLMASETGLREHMRVVHEDHGIELGVKSHEKSQKSQKPLQKPLAKP